MPRVKCQRSPNVQRENGFTVIAHELLEELSSRPFSPRAFRIVLRILRDTYGWNRKTCTFNIQKLANSIGLPRQHTNETVNRLVDWHVLLHEKDQIGFNKQYDQWDIHRAKDVTKSVTSHVTKSVTSHVTKSVTSRPQHVTESVTSNRPPCNQIGYKSVTESVTSNVGKDVSNMNLRVPKEKKESILLLKDKEKKIKETKTKKPDVCVVAPPQEDDVAEAPIRRSDAMDFDMVYVELVTQKYPSFFPDVDPTARLSEWTSVLSDLSPADARNALVIALDAPWFKVDHAQPTAGRVRSVILKMRDRYKVDLSSQPSRPHPAVDQVKAAADADIAVARTLERLFRPKVQKDLTPRPMWEPPSTSTSSVPPTPPVLKGVITL